ncbi:LETM1 domain-containing protein 1 [Arctopsyche grandis]|uniref:LETM1 domain-containing protein 1 n=1 Tax=Arctopsyche grandis TaxID=121162 RepID=UPI00406D9693
MLARGAYGACDFAPFLLLKRSFANSQILLDNNGPKGKKESKLRDFAMTRYMEYMKQYEQKLEKRFPSAMQVYRLFSEGIKSFYRDLKTFFRIRYILLGNEEDLSSLKRSDIELYNQMPKDMLKISPVLLLSALPFANYVVFPIAYMYPQKFLTSHFWTPEQKNAIELATLKERLKYNSITLKSLKQYSSSVKDKSLHDQWSGVLDILNNGSHPSIEDLIACKPLFVNGPYCLNNLHFSHTYGLLHLHGLRASFSLTQKLIQRAFILREMDAAIGREGGVNSLEMDTLKMLCTIRGLHAADLNKYEIIQWLQKWLQLSNCIERESFSLLLHAPLLLGSNHSNNIKLMQIKKQK